MAIKEFIKKHWIPLSIAGLGIVAVGIFAIPILPGVFTGLVAGLEAFPLFSLLFASAAKLSYAATVATACAIVGVLGLAAGFLLEGLIALSKLCFHKIKQDRFPYESIPTVSSEEIKQAITSPYSRPELQPSTLPPPPLASLSEDIVPAVPDKEIIRQEENSLTQETIIIPVDKQNQHQTSPSRQIFTEEVSSKLVNAKDKLEKPEGDADIPPSPILPARS